MTVFHYRAHYFPSYFLPLYPLLGVYFQLDVRWLHFDESDVEERTWHAAVGESNCGSSTLATRLRFFCGAFRAVVSLETGLSVSAQTGEQPRAGCMK